MGDTPFSFIFFSQKTIKQIYIQRTNSFFFFDVKSLSYQLERLDYRPKGEDLRHSTKTTIKDQRPKTRRPEDQKTKRPKRPKAAEGRRPKTKNQKPLKVKDQRQTKQRPPMKDQRPQRTKLPKTKVRLHHKR